MKWLAILASVLCACSTTVRPVSPVAHDTHRYAEAFGRAQQEQLLLNIVRLRYNDPVTFVEGERLTTQDRLGVDTRLSSATSLDGSPFREVLSGNFGAQRSHQPTVVYQSLRGKQYADQLLRPLPPESVFLLSQSGWSLEQLMLCCVARIGDVDNARLAAGPRLGHRPENERFRELAALMARAQDTSNLIVQVVDQSADGGPVFFRRDEATVILKWWARSTDGAALRLALESNWASDVQEIGGGRFATEIATRGNDLGDFAFRGRSILGVMSALSLTVQVPQAHAALVANPPTQPGEPGACAVPALGDEVLHGYFNVQSATDEPASAAVKVRYRNHWFYINDECLTAKSTLALLGQLYEMQASLSDGRDTLILLGN